MRDFMYFSSAISSVVLIVIGMLWYSKETKRQKAKPNFVVITFWTLIAIINAATYHLIVLDYFKSSLVLISIAVNVYVLIVIIVHKNYILLKRDIWIVIIGSVCIILLILFTSVKETHVTMQILNTIVYIPLIWGIYDRKGKEPFGPWVIISIATICNLITILVHYSDYWSLIHPLRSIVLQILVIILIKFKEIQTAPSGELFFLWRNNGEYRIYISSKEIQNNSNKNIYTKSPAYEKFYQKINQTFMVCALPSTKGFTVW